MGMFVCLMIIRLLMGVGGECGFVNVFWIWVGF